MEIYHKVHEFRRDELAYIVHQIDSLIGLDSERLLLMGHSEGAVAVGTWNGEASARILLAWSCEENYFSRNHRIAGNHQTTFILNVVGSNDEYFAARNSLSASDDVVGHGVRALSDFRNAKVVIYPGEGHRVLDNPNASYDLVAFFERWYQNYEQVLVTQERVNPN